MVIHGSVVVGGALRKTCSYCDIPTSNLAAIFGIVIECPVQDHVDSLMQVINFGCVHLVNSMATNCDQLSY